MIEQFDNAVIVNQKLRIQILSPSLIRLEERGPKGFEDRPTFLVVERSWPGASCTVRESRGTVRITTGSAQVIIPEEATTLDSVTIKGPQGGTALWTGAEGGPSHPTFVDPAKPGRVWVMADEPRIVPPPWGACPPPHDLSTNRAVSGWELKNRAKDIYVFVYDKDAALWRREFLKLTGRIPLPPVWAFGYWNSWYHPYTEKEALADIDEHRERDYPLDIFVVDTDWRVGGSGGYEVEKKLFPNMARFLKEAHKRHVRVMFNDHPQPNGMRPLEPDMLKFRYEGLTGFLSMGLDHWWYDKNWHEIIDGPVKGIDREVWGQYLYTSIIRQVRPRERTMIMSMRSHHPASHRYPVWWTGDIPSTYDALRDGIRDTVNDGIGLLMPYVNQDLGGHLDQPEDELYVRFLQYGCLCPITRVHGTLKDGLFRYPWLFGKEAADIIREYVKLRYRLLPTIYSAARRSYDEGLPIVRKLTLEWPAHKEARANDQYLFGDDLLVAPVHGPAPKGGEAERAVWIPPGRWEDAWTGEIIDGPTTLQVAVPLRRTPVYVRRGGILVMAPEMNYVGEKPWDPVTLEVYPPRSGSIERDLYEDDGGSVLYQEGQCARTPITVTTKKNRMRVEIGAARGTYAGQLKDRAWQVRIHLEDGQRPARVRVDDREIEEGSGYRLLEPDAANDDMILAGWGSPPREDAGAIVEVKLQSLAADAHKIDLDVINDQ